MKKLIETALPLSEINAKTIAEKAGSAGNPANLHMWWGRSPMTSSVAALTAAMVDAPESTEELKSRLNRLQENGYAEFGEKPTVFDPFSGFGGIPIAAQKLGLPVVAGDLNPVAVMLTKAAVEIPAKFANRCAVNPYSLLTEYTGCKGLAEDVRYYGEWLYQRGQEVLQAFYPNEPEGKTAAWVWARTVKCHNPACGCTFPLASSFVLNSKAGQECWAEPVAEGKQVRFAIRNGPCPAGKETNKHGSSGAVFRCPACGTLTTDDYVKQEAVAHRLGARMMAVSVETDHGRICKAPSAEQEAAADMPAPETIPAGAIPDNAHWFSPPGFGITEYSDLFSPRQLTMLTTFCDLLTEVQDRVASDALSAGMSAYGGGLAEGGTGALAYGQAVSVYLAFVIDKIADSNSTICTWRTAGGNIRNTFGRQAIPMTWTYAEGNPFSGITGNFKTALKNVADAVEQLPCGTSSSIELCDAVTGNFPENVMVCTEFPYYSNIGYSYLSDFFYIWLRRSLKPIYPELFNPLVVQKEDLTTSDIYFGRTRKECNQEYEEQMGTVLEKLHRCANPDFPHLLFFEFHKADAAAIQSQDAQGQAPTPWEIMLQGILTAGFSITAVWPMRAEPVSEKADAARVLIVVRKAEKAGQTTRRAFLNTLKRELPEQLDTLFCAGVDDCDKAIAGMGCGLAVFSRYKRVLNADGTEMAVHDALQAIHHELQNHLNPGTEDTAAGNPVAEEE